MPLRTKYEIEFEKAARLYAPKPEGRILNTTHVRDREDSSGSDESEAASRLESEMVQARRLYSPKAEGRVLNSTHVVDRNS